MPSENTQPPRWQKPHSTIDGFFGGAPPGPAPKPYRPLPSRINGGLDQTNTTANNLPKTVTSDKLANSAGGLSSRLPSREPLLSTDPKVLAEQAHSRNRQRIKRIAMRSIIVMVAIVVLGSAALFTKGYLQLHHIFSGGSSSVVLTGDINPNELNGEGDGRINILLLGIGGGNHDGPDLTDTMLLASIDPVNNKAALLSIPRDLWVKMPNNYISNYQKINAAYESGKYKYLGEDNASNSNQKAIEAGFKAADSTVSSVIGIPINYNVLVNFQAFQQAVNTVGGVTINVPTELYDPTMAWMNNWNPVIAKPGVQTMNGYKTLMYVRSRETTSDFARTQRQRAVILALKQKVLTLGTLSNPVKISSLMSAFGENVRTDISLKNAEALYSLMKNISNKQIESVGLTSSSNNYVTTSMIDGLSVVEPSAGEFDYSQIQSYVRNTLKDGFIAKENANIMVLNGTSTPGLATQVADTLKSYGYRVGTVGNAPQSNYQNTIIVDRTHGKDKYTSHYLHNRFHAIVTQKLPDKNIQPKGANFVIILGEDAANSS